ncbi:hypothetical protein [Thermodesulfovibrio yellowstonii]|uniref:hypothetical protein n=1 Tax=Thermodesulfovibrio yellowstonii TaxID=28262 RepID=UPI0024909559|nr:hypothetical protein [Thermodesulfovibrio islandicus]
MALYRYFTDVTFNEKFINAHVQKFCAVNGIKFSRSRPYRKNDAPYVESKNWSMVRVYVGWLQGRS